MAELPSGSDLSRIGPKAASKLLKWYQDQARELPWRSHWALHGDPYPVWLSEVMLQQTTIEVVIPKFAAFIQRFPTIKPLAESSWEEVQPYVSGLGYYSRFERFHRAARSIMQRGGRLPQSYQQWLDLPGVGPYTAAAVSSITLGEAHPVVDGNVERVLCRLLDWRLPPNHTSLKPHYSKAAAKLLVPKHPGDSNQAMMELGQLVCRSTKPDCRRCPLKSHCYAYDRSSQTEAPQPKLKQEKIQLETAMLVLEHRGRLGLWQRSERCLLVKARLGFPTLIGQENGLFKLDGEEQVEIKTSRNRLPSSYKNQEPTLTHLGVRRHSITRHRIENHLWYLELKRLKDLPAWCSSLKLEWVPQEQVGERLLTNFDKKTWQLYLKLKAADNLSQ